LEQFPTRKIQCTLEKHTYQERERERERDREKERERAGGVIRVARARLPDGMQKSEPWKYARKRNKVDQLSNII